MKYCVKNSIIKKGIILCNKSNYKIKMGAIIFNGKKVFSCGYNKSPGIVKNAFKNREYIEYAGSIHAEVHAILNCRENIKGSSIFIIRIIKNGEFRLAKPCKRCMSLIIAAGIKKIFYTISVYPYIEMIKL